MTLTRYIWVTLCGAASIIVFLLAAWGSDIHPRLNFVESREAMHEQALKDIHQDLLRIERLLEEKQNDR
jgi:hypothetical protein